jgi:hypothetical protein
MSYFYFSNPKDKANSSKHEETEKKSPKSSDLFNDGAEMVGKEFLSLQAGEHVHLGGYELLLSHTISPAQ